MSNIENVAEQTQDTSAPQVIRQSIIQSMVQNPTTFRCKMCRYALFKIEDVIPHKNEKNHQLSYKKLRKEKSTMQQKMMECSSHFLDKMDWMGDMMSLEGNLTCPKCNYRVGQFRWHGMQCSCGCWVTPAISVPKSRVDPS